MAQAKVLNEREFRKMLLYIANHKHAARNKAILLTTHLAGLRVGEVASLTLRDVLNDEGQIKDEIYLSADQTKGDRGRTVLVPKRLQEELLHYLQTRFGLKDLVVLNFTDTSRALFYTQKYQDRGFTPNTLAQQMHYLYKRAGVDGASSHSGRRGFITALANKGANVRVLMALAGHRNIGTTQRYIELNPAMLRTTIEMI